MRLFHVFVMLSCLHIGRVGAQDAGPSGNNGGTRAIHGTSLTGEPVVVDGAAKVTVVCFLGVECPVVQLYTARLSTMALGLKEQGVQFVGVNGNHQDSIDDVRRFCDRLKPSFPIIRDDSGSIVEAYGAKRTPEVFVLDSGLNIRYQGRIDDQYSPGSTRPAATQHDLKNAIDELLAGKLVTVARTEAAGCLIGRPRRQASDKSTADMPTDGMPGSTTSQAATWSASVGDVLKRNCLECHRTGDIGPFSMESYDEVTGWADTMLETIDNGRMPPWHAESGHRPLANERRMSEQDRQIFRDWVKLGLPKGDESAAAITLPAAKDWQMEKTPDAEFVMRDKPFIVPAEGTVDYQYFVVDPGLKEDKWVRDAQLIPGNRSVVHHAIAFIRPPDGSPFRGVGWLSAYVPGQRLAALPSGYARKVPAGSKIVFQMHYTPNGKEQSDQTKIGLTFCDPSKVTHEVLTAIGIDQEFEIPPQSAAHEVSGSVRWFPKNGVLMSLAPHMHLRGKSFRMSVNRENGEEVLLNVPQYDFNWQHSYVLTEALPLNSVKDLNFTVTFDNSPANPANPDPSQWVTWGDQTWEEMAVVFLEVAEPLNPTPPADDALSVQLFDADQDEKQKDRQKRMETFVDDFFKRLDTNSDGVVLYDEVPLAVRRSFSRFDDNGDKSATREEVRKVAEQRIR